MISTAIPKFVHNRGHSFSKRLYPAGVYYFNHRYCPTPCLIIRPLPGRLAERARLQPLACMSLTQGSLVKQKSNIGVSLTLLDRGHLLHTPSSFNFFPSSHSHANGKLQTKGPLATPSQVSWSLESPYVPPMEARSVLVQEVKNSHLGARMRRNNITPRWQLIQAF